MYQLPLLSGGHGVLASGHPVCISLAGLTESCVVGWPVFLFNVTCFTTDYLNCPNVGFPFAIDTVIL